MTEHHAMLEECIPFKDDAVIHAELDAWSRRLCGHPSDDFLALITDQVPPDGLVVLDGDRR